MYLNSFFCVITIVAILIVPFQDLYAQSFFERLQNFFEKEYTIEEIVSNTVKTNSGVKDLTEDYVVKNVKAFNKLISDIKREVESKKWFLFERDDSERFDIILNGIRNIADFYDRLSRDRDRVERRMNGYIADIEKFYIEIENKINLELSEIAEYKSELKSTLSDKTISVESREIREKSLRQRIEFAERRISMLQTFKLNYSKILPVMNNAKKSIDRFILVVDESSSVYNDAYRTLRLQKDISNAYRTIEEFKSLDYLSNDIMKSWNDLDQIVKVLSEMVGDFKR